MTRILQRVNCDTTKSMWLKKTYPSSMYVRTLHTYIRMCVWCASVGVFAVSLCLQLHSIPTRVASAGRGPTILHITIPYLTRPRQPHTRTHELGAISNFVLEKRRPFFAVHEFFLCPLCSTTSALFLRSAYVSFPNLIFSIVWSKRIRSHRKEAAGVLSRAGKKAFNAKWYRSEWGRDDAFKSL